MGGPEFLKMLLRNSENDKNLSLNQLSMDVLDGDEKPLSKQAIDARFSEKSTLFIKTIFELYLQKSSQTLTTQTELGWMDMFNRVLVKDGTRFDLPEAFKDQFEGFGGKCTSDSAACIQFEYDLKTGKINELKLTSANIPDSKDAQITKENIQKGDLILRDLGYFILNIFEEMLQKEAYFISKLNTQVQVFECIDSKYVLLDFKKLYQKMNLTNQKTIELDVFVGKTHKIATRLVIELVPDEVYSERIREKKKNSSKKGFNLSDEVSNRQRFNLYITNIDKEKLPAPAIRNIYRLRWQIELVFKQWKSTYKIDKTHKMKYNRWMTLFYARLLLMLIHWTIYNFVKNAIFKQKNKILSLSKCLQSLKLMSHEITNLIQKSKDIFQKTIQGLVNKISTKHDLEKKKGRKNQKEIIDLIYCLSEY